MSSENKKSINYQPTCDLQALKARAKMYGQIRQFFTERDVLEVETPLLSQAGVTDVHLASVQALRHIGGHKQIHYLQTSPEFAMKRLLASGSGAIYQILYQKQPVYHGTLPCYLQTAFMSRVCVKKYIFFPFIVLIFIIS